MEETLGSTWKGILTAVKSRVPAGYRVILAHQCGYAGRHFVHLTLENNGRLMSVVIARKQNGETMAGLKQSAQPSGIPVYQAAAQRYEVAGFETADYLAFVISDQGGSHNLQIASALVPGLHEFLLHAGV
jgi:hypothetical protein